MVKISSCNDSLGNHGISIHIFHCKAFHCFLITISGSLDQIGTVFGKFSLHLYCFFIFLQQETGSFLLKQDRKRLQVCLRDLSGLCISPAYILPDSADKRSIVTPIRRSSQAPAKDSLSACRSTSHFLPGCDSCSPEKREIIFHVKLTVLIILTTNA